MKVTPVLLVESIEKSLPFWVDRLGWKKVAEVPDGAQLSFVMLAGSSGGELMLQTFASAAKDEPKFVRGPGSHTTSLYVEVDDWNDTRAVERLRDRHARAADVLWHEGDRRVRAERACGGLRDTGSNIVHS